jgi:virginiamycin B lyase
VPALELLESRRLLATGGSNPAGIATGAGPDSNIWLTLNSNNIGMINPSDPSGAVTQHPIPIPNSGAGPITAGPEAILYASDLGNPSQIYKVDKSTGRLLGSFAVKEPVDSLIFDSHNDIIYSSPSVGGAGQVRWVDPNVGISSDRLLATVGNVALDLALVPGGNFVLAMSVATRKIYKVDLNHPGQPATPSGTGGFVGGITFDNQGRLFAVYNSTIAQLDPNTFTVLKSSGPLSGLDGLAFDPVTGDLFASSDAVNPASGRGGIYELSLQQGAFLHARLITSSAYPTTFSPDGLEPDGEGNLYVASLADRQIYRYDITTGKLAALTGYLAGLDDIVPLEGSGGHTDPGYWFFERTLNQFGHIDPTTGFVNPNATNPLPNANTQVTGMTAGPGGTVWFTEYSTDKIGVINADTALITEIPITPGSHPYGIVEGPDGNIWFTSAGANQIGMINATTLKPKYFAIDSSGNGEPEGITVGPNSNLWFTLTGTNTIGEFNPTTGKMVGEYPVPTLNAGLSQIVSDPADGSLWFTEATADKVGKINATTKVATDFPVPTAGAAPGAIVVTRNGTIWFTEPNANRIASFSPKNPGSITEYGVPSLAPPPTPTIVNEKPVKVQMYNKKGKKLGKPVFVGFELDFSTAMDPTSARLSANYEVGAWTTKRVKKKLVRMLKPVGIRPTYNTANNSVTLIIQGKQAFAKGGQITVIATPPDGVSSANGQFLDANYTFFEILNKASGVWRPA